MFFDRYGGPDGGLFLLLSLVNGPVGWLAVVYCVLVFLSLTIWKNHIARLDRMTVAARLLGLAIALPFATALLVFVLTLMTAQFSPGRDAELIGVLGSLIGCIGAVIVLLASGVFFLLAIQPGPERSGTVSKHHDPSSPVVVPPARPTLPTREPWED